MAGLEVATPSDLNADVPLVNWSLDLLGNAIPSRTSVGNAADIYQVNDAPLLINTNGWDVRLRYCGADDMRVNLPESEGVLYALDPSASLMPDSTPLQLNFEKPLRGVGAFVTVGGPKIIANHALHVVMWIQVTGTTGWQSVSANGFTGDIQAPGDAPTAAFVGVKTSGGKKIEKVRFDATLMGNRPFRYLLLSPLAGLL